MAVASKGIITLFNEKNWIIKLIIIQKYSKVHFLQKACIVIHIWQCNTYLSSVWQGKYDVLMIMELAGLTHKGQLSCSSGCSWIGYKLAYGANHLHANGLVVCMAFQFGPYGHFPCGPIWIWSLRHTTWFFQAEAPWSLSCTFIIFNQNWYILLDVLKAEPKKIQTSGAERCKKQSPKSVKSRAQKIQKAKPKKM